MRSATFLMLLLALPGLAAAQANRAGTWDFTIGAIYQDGDQSGADMGSSLKVDGDLGLGINIAYNVNDYLAIGLDLDYLSPDFDLSMTDENDPNNVTRIQHTASQFNTRLKATLNLAEGPLVPYVEAGFGWTYLDSNVADGPPVTGCWWHPWWGYICSGYYNTFSGTETTWGGGAGLRYEIAGGTFIKASANYWILETSGGKPEPELASFRLEYGWSF